MKPLAIAVCIVAVVAATAPQLSAQSGELQKYLREVVKSFDFEESHPDLTPIYWSRVGGPGYPAYTRGRFVTDIYHSRATSFRMDLNGGNCVYEYEPRRIQIEPAFDYCLEGWIRTEGLKQSKARLAVWFTDQQGRKVDGSDVFTAEVGETTDWVLVQVHISPQGDAQGRPFNGRPRFAALSMEAIGREAQDIGAKVWFDDIRLYRIPRLAMRLAGNRMLYNQGETVVAELSADGLLASSFPGRLTVCDDRGKVVHEEMAPLMPSETGAARKDVTLPPLPPGAYHVSYGVSGDASKVLSRRASLAVFAPPSGPEYLRGKGFGVADITGVGRRETLVDLLTELSPRIIKIPLWLATTDENDMQRGNADLEVVINRLRTRGVSFVGVLAETPDYIRRQIPEDIRGITDLLAMKEDLWQKPIGFTVSRYAGVISAWQIGKDGDPSVTRLQTEPQALDPATKQIDRLTAGVPLGVPWPALYAWPGALPERVDFVALRIGQEILPEQIQEYLSGQAPGGGPRVFLTLEPISGGNHLPDERLFDFVSRVLAAKRAGVEEIFFSHLVDPEVGLMRAADQPTELMVVARTLCDVLGGTRFAGWMPLENAGAAMVFERADGSEIICLWKEHAAHPAREPLFLGDNLVQIDLWGNRTPVPQIQSVSTVELQTLPVFITNIDPQISRTRRSFRLREANIPSAYRRHQTAIEFTNGFERGVSGYVELRVPQGWNVDPTIIKFNLSEGERFVQPLVITVPYNETVGDKDFIAEFSIDAKSSYRFVAVARARFEMPTGRTRASVFQEGPNLIIEQEVTNIVDRTMNYHAYVQVPGLPMLNHFVPKLKPGETVVRRYVLPYTKGLEQRTALVGIRDDTVDRGFANLLLPLGGVHDSELVRTSSAGDAKAQ